MTIDIGRPESWIASLLETLPEEKMAAALKEDNPDWEYIDGEIVKLGSLAHAQLDIPELQRRGLSLLASESKDFRLVAHLLRTLQHAGDPLLAARLLGLYVEHYWTIAAPHNMAHKKRFAVQVIKRFESGIAGFAEKSDSAQRDALLGELAKLAQCWQAQDVPALAQETDVLFSLYQRAFRDAGTSPSAGSAPAPVTHASSDGAQVPVASDQPVATSPIPPVTIDSHDDKSWRKSLLQVATILCERQPDLALGYRLRRHALWHTITAAPQAESDGRTPLAAVPADRVAEYQARLASADMALWQEVENSLLLAPYWLDGHHLSAQVAQRLGYEDVAQALRDETSRLLARLPQLTTLLFNDRTPFISEQTARWLAEMPKDQAVATMQSEATLQAARACFHEQGLEAALRHLDALPSGEPRDRFWRQYLAAQFMEESGMVQFARQQYRMLFSTGQQMGLADWEPSLLEQLEQKFTAEK